MNMPQAEYRSCVPAEEGEDGYCQVDKQFLVPFVILSLETQQNSFSSFSITQGSTKIFHLWELDKHSRGNLEFGVATAREEQVFLNLGLL